MSNHTIKITERRIVTFTCTKCPEDIGTIEGLSGFSTTKIICPACDTAYCLHWGSNGFETWVEEWETYETRHSTLDEIRSKGKQSFE